MDLRQAARLWKWRRGDQVEEGQGAASGLARAIDAGGTDALLGLLLPDADELELADDEVRVQVQRCADAEIRVTTTWSDGTTAASTFRDESRPVHDLVAALHDPGTALYHSEGRWWYGAPRAGADLVLPGRECSDLGSPAFRERHRLRRSGMSGAMAGGIASPALVLAMARAGWLGSLGTGGLSLAEVTRQTDEVVAGLSGESACFNLLHNPIEPRVEEETVSLYLARGVRVVEASAFMGLTAEIVRFRLHGIHESDGRVVTPNRVIAKVSRPEVAEHFLRPAPAALLDELRRRGALTEAQVTLARGVPVAEDLTVEADSGGHTDRRPLSALVPLMRRLADTVAAERGAEQRTGIGAAGGIGDPWSVAGALAMGADYVVTGSVNQATVEAATSDEVKKMLAAASFADVGMGPAPDMFEIGAEVQVLSRGSMYAQRAARLYHLYQTCGSLDQIPADERARLEKQLFRCPLAEVEAETARYWGARDPEVWARAGTDPRHRMALVFRWYLGKTSRWAREGDAGRKLDYQVWCGPAMGLFNNWVKGSALEPLAARTVVAVNEALFRGALIAERVHQARRVGPLPLAADRIVPS